MPSSASTTVTLDLGSINLDKFRANYQTAKTFYNENQETLYKVGFVSSVVWALSISPIFTIVSAVVGYSFSAHVLKLNDMFSAEFKPKIFREKSVPQEIEPSEKQEELKEENGNYSLYTALKATLIALGLFSYRSVLLPITAGLLSGANFGDYTMNHKELIHQKYNEFKTMADNFSEMLSKSNLGTSKNNGRVD